MDKLVSSAIEENPIAFKREFETLMKAKLDDLVSQQRTVVANSVDINDEETETE